LEDRKRKAAKFEAKRRDLGERSVASDELGMEYSSGGSSEEEDMDNGQLPPELYSIPNYLKVLHK